MAIQINLLQNQKDYTRLENAFHIGRVGVAILGVMCLVTLVVLFALKKNVQTSLDQTMDQRDNLQAVVNDLQDQEARVILINEKMEAMNSVLSDVPDYSRHVETLLAYTPVASQSGQIQRIALDRDVADMVMTFPNVLELSRFLATVESDSFQQNFQGLEIGSIELEDLSKELLLTLHVTF